MSTTTLDRIEIALWGITGLSGSFGLLYGFAGYVVTGVVFVAIAVAAATLAGITRLVLL